MVFGNASPLEVDLGSGDGGFLVASAEENPDRNYLGIERLLGRVRKSCGRIQRAGLGNTRILRVESHYALGFLFPPRSIDVLHVAFPDPWPKRRHTDRRIFRPEVIKAAHLALAPGGEIRFSTDHLEYYEWVIEKVMPTIPFRAATWEPSANYPQTDFEKRFRNRGLPIHRLRLLPLDNPEITSGPPVCLRDDRASLAGS